MAGINQAKTDNHTKQVVITSISANEININTSNNTKLTGAIIATVDKTTDKDGNIIITDNTKLNLNTNTLEVSSLNTTTNNNTTSTNIDTGNKISVDYTQDKTNTKTKVLATIGKGNIQITDKENSNTKLLNRDIKNNKVAIYNIKSHKGFKGELDTRLLTKQGRG